jgi:hypothetical protein
MVKIIRVNMVSYSVCLTLFLEKIKKEESTQNFCEWDIYFILGIEKISKFGEIESLILFSEP